MTSADLEWAGDIHHWGQAANPLGSPLDLMPRTLNASFAVAFFFGGFISFFCHNDLFNIPSLRSWILQSRDHAPSASAMKTLCFFDIGRSTN
jgi:hypothetical protein